MDSLNYSENTKVVSRGVLSTRMSIKPLETGEIFFNYKQSNTGTIPFEKNPYEIWIGSVDPNKPIRIGAQGFITIAGNFSAYFPVSTNIDDKTKEEFEKTAVLPTEGTEGLRVGNVYFIDTDIYIPKTPTTPEFNGSDLAVYLGDNAWWRINNNISSASGIEYTFNSGRPSSLEESEYNSLDAKSLTAKASLDNLYSTKAGLDSNGKIFYDQIPDAIKDIDNSNVSGVFQVHHENSLNAHNTLTVNPEFGQFDDNISKTDSYKIDAHHVDIKGDLDIKNFRSTLAFGKLSPDISSNQAFGFDNKMFGFPFNYTKEGYGTKDIDFGNLNIDGNAQISGNIDIDGHINTSNIDLKNTHLYDSDASDTLNISGTTGNSTCISLSGKGNSLSAIYDGQKLSISSPVSLLSSEDVTGKLTLSNDLDVSGNSVLSGSLDVGGNATINSSLTVSKSITSTTGMVSGALSNIIEKYALDLSGLSIDNFYPITFGTGCFMIDCEIQSESHTQDYSYNKNIIHFQLVAGGWTDTPVRISILEYGTYQDEITIGSIGYGINEAEKAIWLRGGLHYEIFSNTVPILHSTDYVVNASDGIHSETFSVGTNTFGGTNSSVVLLWSPDREYSTTIQSTNIKGKLKIDDTLKVDSSTSLANVSASKLSITDGEIGSLDTSPLSILSDSGSIRMGSLNEIQSYSASNTPTSLYLSNRGGDTHISHGGGKTYFGSSDYTISEDGSTYSGKSANASLADHATLSDNATHASEADHSTSSDSATHASLADHSTSSDSATHATEADHSTSSDNSKVAYSLSGPNTTPVFGANCVTTGLQSSSFDNSPEGWAHYLIFNHGDGSTYYHYNLRFPFWDIPQYQRMTDGKLSGWKTFITSENIGDQSVKYASSSYVASNGLVVGSVYIQFPSTSEPSALFGGTWANISSWFAGYFLRVEGGDAASFGNAQGEGLPNITGGVRTTAGVRVGRHAQFTAQWGGLQEYGERGGDGAWDSHSGLDGWDGIYLNASASNGIYGSSSHVTPVNYAVRVWQRRS